VTSTLREAASRRAEILPEEARSALAHLRLIPPIRADGRVSGLHRSTHLGQSLEFSELKAYSFGDNLRAVDWRVFARTDRLYVRRFFDETNLQAHLVLDASGSMAYPAPRSKFVHAASVLAGLAYVLLRQSDEVGLVVAHEKRPKRYPPRSSPAYLSEFLEYLAEASASDGTTLESAVRELACTGLRRGLVLIASDFLTRLEPILAVLQSLVVRGHCVAVLHVLSPEERAFPFRGPTVFRSVETEETALVDATALRRHYLDALERFVGRLRARCHEAGVFYVPLQMDRPPHENAAEVIRSLSRAEAIPR